MRENMITGFFIWKDLNLRAKFAGFLCNQRSEAVYGGLIVRRGFHFNKEFQE
jgi:hypothetical protein